jgi:hypothetical protein
MKNSICFVASLLITAACHGQTLLVDDYLKIHAFSLMNEATSAYCNKFSPEQSNARAKAQQYYLTNQKKQLDIAKILIDTAIKKGADLSKYNVTEITKKLEATSKDKNTSEIKDFCQYMLNLSIAEANLSPAEFSTREFETSKQESEIRYGRCNVQLLDRAVSAASRFLAITKPLNENLSFPKYETDPMLIVEVREIHKTALACFTLNKKATQRGIDFQPDFTSTKTLADSLVSAMVFNKDNTAQAIEVAEQFLKSRNSPTRPPSVPPSAPAGAAGSN